MGADAHDVLVDQVLEHGPLAFEAGRVHVGDVVRNDLDIELLREHSSAGDAKGTHGRTPFLTCWLNRENAPDGLDRTRVTSDVERLFHGESPVF